MRDLIVVGGGPAGLVTALHARRAGLAVAVLEPRPAPVDKACGEGLMPGAVRALAELGIDPGGVPFRPHDAAMFTIGDVLMDQAHKLRKLYSQAAEGYAYGTAWAILRVLEGQQPDAVQLGRSREGFYVVPGELSPIPPLMPGLERWNGYNKLVHAHARWAICEEAGLFAEYLDEQPQLSDHEAGELHEAIDTATGVPDAAYAYGQLAESALRFALLEPRAQHARQQSAR